jgi:hypothetical protein
MQCVDKSVSRSLCVLVLFFFLPFLLPAQSANVSSLISETIDETRLATLHGNRHPFARAQFDGGAAPAGLPFERMMLVLQRSPAQQAALDALLARQQDATSPYYHKWLTPAQFGQQFGPSDQDLQKITIWLGTHGFQVSRVSQGRTVIEFSGTAGQVQEAFHTAIRKYIVDGEEHWANESEPQIPAALAAVIAGVNTLHNFRKTPMHHLAGEFTRTPSGNVRPVQPLFTISGCSGSCYAVGPSDFAAIYNVLPLWNAAPSPIDGTGQTIAIVGETDINPQDVTDFRTLFGLPAANLNIIHDGPAPGILTDGEETEADLDVEWSGAVAKGATIDLVVSASTNSASGVDLSAQYIIDNNLAPVMSESYGLCELGLGTAGNQFYNQLWQQASAQGITVIVSSGDSGAAGCDDHNATAPSPAQSGLAVNGLASTPYDIAVGGTDFNDFTNASTYWNSSNTSTTLASAKGYIPETTWNDTCTNALFGTALGYSTNAETNCSNSQLAHYVSTVGGSGGASNCTTSNGSVASCAVGYPKPSWQTGAGVPNDNARDIPDVSLFASNGFEGSFYAICEADQTSGHSCSATGNFLGVGGTSASAPAFAGIMALVNQKTQTQQGNANYILYGMAAQQPNAFNDVTAGTIATPCAKNTLNCTLSNGSDTYGILSGYTAGAGYDLATGLGSVNANNLVNQWTSVTNGLQGTSTTLALNPPASPIPHGTAVPVNISVAPTQGGGTATGRVSLLASTGPDVADFTLNNGSVSAPTNSLPGGSYTVSAHYAGDETFSASNSSPVSVTVSPEASVTTAIALTAAGNGSLAATATGPYGGIFLQATVQGQSGVGNATGTVNFTVDGQSIAGNPFRLNANGQAVTPSAIPTVPGTHSIAASYGGDASFNAGNSTASALTITKAATTIAVTSSAKIVNAGSNLVLTATISSSATGNSPTGTVSFFSGTTPIGGPAAVSAATGPGNTAMGTASLSTAQLPVGTDSITARYNGDGNYGGATSAVASVTAIGQTSTTVKSSNGTIQQGSSVTFTATVAPTQSGGPAVTGTVQFSENGTSFGSAAVSASGVAQVSVTSLPSGALNITANYPGDTNYGASSESFTETVAAGPSFTVSASPASIVATTPGASAVTTLTFIGVNGFSATISLPASACSGLPAQSSCIFTPSTVALSPGTTTATATLTIVTTAASFAAPIAPSASASNQGKSTPGIPKPGAIALAFGLLIGILSVGLRRAGHSWPASASFALIAALLLASAGCGSTTKSGNSSNATANAGTPAPSTSTVSITVTGGSITQVSNVILTVQ